MSSPSPVRVLVVGGGISGLSLAHYLKRYSRALQRTAGQRTPLHVTLAEKSSRFGGWINSDLSSGQ